MKMYLFGYLLIVSGVVIMVLAVLQVYYLFTNQAEPFQVFDAPVAQEAPELTPERVMADPTLIAKAQSEMITQVMQKEMGKSLNMGATLFFMYFLMTFGYRLSMLGTQLVRPIKVAIKAKTVEVDPEATQKLQSENI